MSEIKTTPGVAEVREALAAASAAWTHTILLRQPGSMNASALQNFSHRNGPEILALADDLVRVRNQFNTLLGKVSTAAQARAKELGNAYLTKLLGQQVPGPVTLQVGNRHQATFIVTQLTSVQEASDGISGIVATVDASGTHHDSHHFYMKDGTAHFSEPDIY